MKVHSSVGSKERFLEIFQGVNKVRVNEVATNVVQSGTQLVEKAFEELKNKQASIKQTNTQTVNDDNFVEIITNDNDGNEITFRFKVSSTEGDQEGVYNVDDALLVNFKIKSQTLNVDMPENMKAVQEFNQNHSGEIMSVVGEYANFETDTLSVDDEMYEEAIKLIDKVPYKKGTEQMQTSKAYGDEKPTNPALRVKSDELNQFVSEEDEYVDDEYTQGGEEVDIMALPPDYSAADLPKDDEDDDGTIGVDPYDQIGVGSDEEASPEELEIYSQAYDNITATGNQAPTISQIEMEVLKLKREKGLAEPFKKNRAKPKGAEAFYEQKHVVDDMNADTAIAQSYDKTLSPELKERIIKTADEMLSAHLGVKKFQMPKEQYIKMVKDLAIQMYQRGSTGLNEEQEKGEYPDPIGKKFKPKSQMPKKKKKPQSVVKLSEVSEIPQEYWGNHEDEMNEDYEGGEKEIKKNYLTLKGDLDFQKLANGYEGLLKLKRSDFRRTDVVQTALSSLRRAITEYLNVIKGINATEEDVQNYFENMLTKFSSVNENEILPEPAIEPDFDSIGMVQGDDIEQLMQDKEEQGEMIQGGLADGKSPSEFDQEQIKLGLKVEMEHTDDPLVALEIALDHLTEDPEYYTVKDDPEASAQANASMEAGEEKSEVEKENPMLYPDGWKEMDGMFMNPNNPMYKKMHGIEDEMTDELLGYKPHNVNDYSNEEFNYAAAEREYEDKENMRQNPDDYDRDEDETQDHIPSEDEIEAFKNDRPDFKEKNLTEEDGFEEYQGNIGDRYEDAEGNQFTVRDKVKGGVTLQGQGGEKETDTGSLSFMKKLSEGKTEKKEIITEEQVKMARQALNKRGLTEGMTKKEAVQILIRHNIK